MLRSGLVIDVPAAETATGRWRRQLDPQANLGVPPHVTVLYPFAPPNRIDGALLTKLRSLLSPVRPFAFQLIGTDWFGDGKVLWLAPEPADKFRHLTEALSTAFPEYPPYGGDFDGSTPHLTIGTQGAPGELRRAERDIRQRLPIATTAHAVALMVEGLDRRWQKAATFQLEGRG